MIRVISHRGYLEGPNSDVENNPNHIVKLFKKYNIFDVEVDLWKIGNELFLGHDDPKNKVSKKFFSTYKNRLWIHCKNEEALIYMHSTNVNEYMEEYERMNYFWHESDQYTVTSKGHIWRNNKNLNGNFTNSVVLLFEKEKLTKENIAQCSESYGICTDYPIELKTILSTI